MILISSYPKVTDRHKKNDWVSFNRRKNFCLLFETIFFIESNDKSSITSGKRKIHDLTESNDDSTKRLLLSTNMSTSYRRPFNSSLPVKLQNTCQTSKVAAEPLDFSVKKKCQLEKKFENSPINLSMDKFPKAHCSPKMFQCQFCSVRFCSLETLHAHKKNYCGGMYQRKFQLERENPILLNNFDKQSYVLTRFHSDDYLTHSGMR